MVRADYRLDSELLVANPPEEWLLACGADATDAIGGHASSIYYRWDGRRLIALDLPPHRAQGELVSTSKPPIT